jgi:hypothetical protein
LRSLVAGLPEGSRAWCAQRGVTVYWSRTEQLLAAIYDLLNVHDWHYVSAHSKQRVRRPTPLPRPGFERARGKGTVVTFAEARRILPGAWDELTEAEQADRTARGMAPGQAPPEKSEVLS